MPQDKDRWKRERFPRPCLSEPEGVHENPFYKIVRITADFGEYSRDYYVSQDGVRAGIVAVRDGRVLLVRQYRLLIDDYSLEIPGGALHESESPEEAAIRECLEETGVRCTGLQPLVSYLLALDIRDNPTHIFFCHDFVSFNDAVPMAQEAVGHEWVPLETCIRMIFEGKITDSFSIIALLSYWTRLSGDTPMSVPGA